MPMTNPRSGFPLCYLLAISGSVLGQGAPAAREQGGSGGGTGPLSGRGAQKQTPPSLDDLPVMGVANVTSWIEDLNRGCVLYTGVLGLAEAFDSNDKIDEIRLIGITICDRRNRVTPLRVDLFSP